MTPEEVFSTYGVDVSKLSTPYSSYHIATSQDLWLCVVGTRPDNNDPTGVIDVRIGDLIIETPDDYRSNIYAYKIPSRHVNLTGPDFFYYVYHPAYMLGTLRICVTEYLNRWANRALKGTLTLRLSNNKNTFQIYIDGNVVVKEGNSEYVSSSLDSVFSKWGELFVVQNYVDFSYPGYINCCFVADLPNID